MENLPLISVIVPVYKVEAYLDKCISSIVNQHYTNLEIILVDDGSPDNCSVMCDAWAEKDSRIKVIHKRNGGLSDARNAGMAVASGEYIGFVDSDDYIAPNMYSVLLERMTADSSDIAACGVEMIWEDATPSRMLTTIGSTILEAQDAMESIIQESWLKQPVWYKLYKADLVRDIPFAVGKYHEDVFWSYQAIGRAKRVSVFDTPCYFYTQRSGSIMGENYSIKRLDALEAKIARLRYVEAKFPELLMLAKRDLWGSCIYAGQMLIQNCPPEMQEVGASTIGKIMHSYPIQITALDLGNIKQSIWLIMAKLSFRMTCKLRNKLRLGF